MDKCSSQYGVCRPRDSCRKNRKCPENEICEKISGHRICMSPEPCKQDGRCPSMYDCNREGFCIPRRRCKNRKKCHNNE